MSDDGVLDKLQPKPTFTASLVRIGTMNKVPRAIALASQGKAVDGAKLDMAYALARFFLPLIQEAKDPNDIILRLDVNLLVPDDAVPKGVACTPIIFQEAPK